MAKIKILKDNELNTIYPQSITGAIVDANGTNLDTILQTVVTTGAEEEIDEVIIGYEDINNKVTEITEESTNIQYPSAKAVYDFVNGQDLSEYAKTTDIPTKVSELINDNEYLTSESDPTVPSYVKSITENNINNWNNKAEKSDVPTMTSQLTNDSAFAPISYSTEDLEAGVTALATGAIHVVYE